MLLARFLSFNFSVSCVIYFSLDIRSFIDSTSDHFFLPTDAFSFSTLASASFAFVSSSVAFFSASSLSFTFWRAASIVLVPVVSAACAFARFSLAAARSTDALASASFAWDIEYFNSSSLLSASRAAKTSPLFCVGKTNPGFSFSNCLLSSTAFSRRFITYLQYFSDSSEE